MSNTKIVAIRADWDEVNETYTGLRRMNQKMAKTLRKAANAHGIKQTAKIKHNGKAFAFSQRLEFYFMGEDQLNEINNPEAEFMAKLVDTPYLLPLLVIDQVEFSGAVNAVNSKPDYQGGMDYDVHNRYKSELLKAMVDCMTLVNNDPKRENKAGTRFIDIKGYKVGDLVGRIGDTEIANGIVTKVTKKTLTIAKLYIEGHPDAPYYKSRWVGLKGTINNQHWDFTVPYAKNADLIRFDESTARNYRYKDADDAPKVLNKNKAIYSEYYYCS